MRDIRGTKLPGRRLCIAGTLLFAFLAGCSRDPNIRKEKYLETGNRYLQNQQYREAAIEYRNALQIDPRFASGHYQLAQSYLKQGMSREIDEISCTLSPVF